MQYVSMIFIIMVIFIIIAAARSKAKAQGEDEELEKEEQTPINVLSNNVVNHPQQEQDVDCDYCGSSLPKGTTKCPYCSATIRKKRNNKNNL